MTFWDGFLPALGVFAAAGVAYVTWHFWKWVLGAVTMLAVAALTSMWATDRADAYYAALFRNELVASGSVATTCGFWIGRMGKPVVTLKISRGLVSPMMKNRSRWILGCCNPCCEEPTSSR